MLRTRSFRAGDIPVKKAHQSEDNKYQKEQTPSIASLLLFLLVADIVEKGHGFFAVV